MWTGRTLPGCRVSSGTTPSQAGHIKNLNSNKIKSKLAQDRQASNQQKVARTVGRTEYFWHHN